MREGRLIARGAVDPVVEHAVDQVRRLASPDLGEDAQVHQQISVAVEDDGAVTWPGQREAESDGGRHAHRADHVEVLRPVAERERLSTDVAISVDDRLAAERLERGAERGQARDPGLGDDRERRRLLAAISGRRPVGRRSVSVAHLDDARRDQERDRLEPLLHLRDGPGEIGLDRSDRKHPVGDATEREELRRDIAHQDVLRGVLALVAAPGHEEQRRQSVHQRQRGERVEAGAEPRVLHEDRGAAPGEPRAGGEPDRDVLSHGRHVRDPRMRLECRDQILDERARDARGEIDAVTLEQIGELCSGDAHDDSSLAKPARDGHELRAES